MSAQTGLSVGELVAQAAEASDDINKPIEALKTGEPIPILFTRRRNGAGGVMVQPKMTEAYFANPIIEQIVTVNGVDAYSPVQSLQYKYLLVLSEGCLPQLQIRDIFQGACRIGTFNQKCDGRAGVWNPGNAIDAHFDYVITPNEFGYYIFDYGDLDDEQSAKIGNFVAYRLSTGTLYIGLPYIEHDFPVFCGTSGTYDGLTTLSFEYTETADPQSERVGRAINVFVRNGLQVTRLVDGTTAESDNYADLVKYLFQKNNRLADDLIDDAALTIAAKFTHENGFLFNGALRKSQNLLDWMQATSINFLLRLSNSGGKFGLIPRLPYNTDFSIKTTQVTPEFTFTEEHIVPDGFEIEYISLEDREPVAFVVQWRQQPEADFGLTRTVEVRYENEATDGPFVSIDMSGYCVDEDHAIKVGVYRLAQRKFITHHLRITVRERSYNASLVIGDLVRVRLRRETTEGEVEYHDKMYEITRIEKPFSATITYDLTHFPIDSQGRSILALEVDAASGAGNVIDVGRTDFTCDENSSSSTTSIGSSSGGGGTSPGTGDTDFDQPDSGYEDSPYPDGENNPDDPLDEDLTPQITGYTGTPTAGDTLTFDPGCEGYFTTWYAIDINTGAVTVLGSGYQATLNVQAALQQQGVTVYAEGRCPDPSSADGLGPIVTSNQVNVFDEIVDCPGGSDSGGQGTFTKVFNVGSAYPATFSFSYQAYTIQDRFIISGAASYDSGSVSGSRTLNIAKTSEGQYITVTVEAPLSGTAWNYSVGCAS